MPIADLLVPEYDIEMATTRRVLERVRDEDADWKPHPKSFSMAHLAQLVSMMPSWVTRMMHEPEIDIAPKDRPAGAGYTNQPTAKLLTDFDANVAGSRAALAAGTDAQYDEPWTLKAAGHEVQTASRYLMIRTTALNHIVHHRAQLGVYLRLLDQSVPQIYGPTADER